MCAPSNRAWEGTVERKLSFGGTHHSKAAISLPTREIVIHRALPDAFWPTFQLHQQLQQCTAHPQCSAVPASSTVPTEGILIIEGMHKQLTSILGVAYPVNHSKSRSIQPALERAQIFVLQTVCCVPDKTITCLLPVVLL